MLGNVKPIEQAELTVSSTHHTEDKPRFSLGRRRIGQRLIEVQRYSSNSIPHIYCGPAVASCLGCTHSMGQRAEGQETTGKRFISGMPERMRH